MKLIKSEDEQGTMYSLSGDNLPDNYVLSKQNCEEEFAKAMGVVDVEKLAIELYPYHFGTEKRIAFKSGFNKAMELNKDKVFTRQDIIHALTYGVREAKIGRTHSQILEEYRTNHLQQPTEIDVEIVTESMNIDEIREQRKGFLNANLNKPKLDNKGRLILKII
jgi:hypothetical protein